MDASNVEKVFTSPPPLKDLKELTTKGKDMDVTNFQGH
jgi:hypothetical protein